jgi:sporulation protein YunB
MKHRKKRTIRLLALLLAAAITATALAMRQRIAPIAEGLAVTVVSDQASAIIVEAVGEELEQQQLDYDRLVTLEKDLNGTITALRTNMLEINRLKVRVLAAISDRVSRLSEDDLGIAVGSLIAPEFFSGRGPEIPIRILSVTSSEAKFSSCLTAAGINQTLHQIVMTVYITATVLLPTGTFPVNVESQVVIAETVLIGAVPDTYIGALNTKEE